MSNGFQPVGVAPVERFELQVATLECDGARIAAPIVDGWVQLEFTLLRAPQPEEEAAFFTRLSALRDTAGSPPSLRWFLLHKPPGVKLRLRLGADIERIAKTAQLAADWRLPWLVFSGFGSFFDQAELRPISSRDDCDALLAAAADALMDAAVRGRRAVPADWADALVDVAVRYTQDRWIAYEALARLERLREGAITVNTPEPGPPFHPTDLADRLPRPVAPEFAASVALIQSLNLMMNLWALGPRFQNEALKGALARLRPSVMEGGA